MELSKALLKARRTWNAAAHNARSLSEPDAAEELYTAARAVQILLRSHVALIENDGEDQDDYRD